MCAESFINALFVLVTQSTPCHTTHDWMQVIAVGTSIPAKQATIFQVSQDGDECVFTGQGLSSPTSRATSVS